jgi:iron complex transport system ATP-binding protein
MIQENARYNDSILMKTKSLSVGFSRKSGHLRLFQDLNLEIRAGELVCFMGANGIGKSTLIRTLAGLHPPLAGSVLVNESGDWTQLTDARPASIAVVLTDKITALNLSVLELVVSGRYPYMGWSMALKETDRKMVERAIDAVKIGHLLNRKLSELSDGQIQLVMITRALVQDTPIVLLDEPTAHLDLNNRVEIMNLLRQLAHTLQKGIVIATHELDLALQTTDCIWLAGNNQTVLRGIPEDLVLNGSFDEIFQFKGFDLKTGKVFHKAWRKISVAVSGSGHPFLWTKNALERNGYSLDDQAPLRVMVTTQSGEPEWHIGGKKFHSIQALLTLLQTNS